jgi:hypothetical protein
MLTPFFSSVNWAVTCFCIPSAASGLALSANVTCFVVESACCGSALTPFGNPSNSILTFPSKSVFCSKLSFMLPSDPCEREVRTSEPARGDSTTSNSNTFELNQVVPEPKSAFAITQSGHLFRGAVGDTLTGTVISSEFSGILTVPDVPKPLGA